MQTLFKDRADAGVKLCKLLHKFQNSDAIVVALPRGGVVTGNSISQHLHLPLEILVVKKIGHPYNPELAVGAITESGEFVVNQDEITRIDADWFSKEKEKKFQEAVQKRALLWSNRPKIDLRNRTVILVDDGVATGLTLFAAIQEIRKLMPKKLIVAVPVAPKDICDKIRQQVDELFVLDSPEKFSDAVGNYYADFSQVEDEQAARLLSLKQDPVLFFMKSYSELASVLLATHAQLSGGDYECVQFSNHELQIQLKTDVHGKDVFYLGSITPPHEILMETFLTCHTCKKEGANRITGIFPYLAYMRHDRNKDQEDHAVDLIAQLSRDSGITKIITVDIHSERAINQFPFTVLSIDPWDSFAHAITSQYSHFDMVVAPDHGAKNRAMMLRTAMSMEDSSLLVFTKERLKNGIVQTLQEGVIKGKSAIIADDILDTGSTMLQTVQYLKSNGVNEIIIAVTHPICSTDTWKSFFEFGVKRIFTTDSVVNSSCLPHKNVSVVPVSEIIRSAMQESMQ